MKEKSEVSFLEFLLIGESKLKIIMNEEDVRQYKIDTVTPDCTDPLCRRAVWSILDRAGREVGFDPSGDKVLVQFYPVKKNECEVFVTKLGILSGASARIVSRSDRLAMLSREKKLYVFEDLENLVLLSKAVYSRLGFAPVADVYRGQGERYYLLIEEYGKGGETVEFPQILEFGRCLSADFSLYLSEHAEMLAAGDGIERFSKYEV